MRKRLLFFLIIFFVAVFYFGQVEFVSAGLPVEAGLGDSCSQPGGGLPTDCFDVDSNGNINNQDCGDSSNDSCSLCEENIQCGGSLICGLSGECVECENDNECNAAQLETCENNVCTTSGGNGLGGLCQDDDNCFGSLKCVDGSCEEPSGATGPRAPGGTQDWTGIDLTIDDVFNIIKGIACWLTRVSVFLMVIFIIIAGLRFMVARGDPTAYTAAKKNFNYVILGLLVIMGVYVIIATIANAVGVTDFSFIPLVC